MSTSATPSAAAVKAEAQMARLLRRIGNPQTLYLRCFATGSGRQVALNMVNAGLYVWTEPVWDNAPTAFQSWRKKRYSNGERRISTLEANAPRLWRGNAADYWCIPSLGDLVNFIRWYKTL